MNQNWLIYSFLFIIIVLVVVWSMRRIISVSKKINYLNHIDQELDNILHQAVGRMSDLSADVQSIVEEQNALIKQLQQYTIIEHRLQKLEINLVRLEEKSSYWRHESDDLVKRFSRAADIKSQQLEKAIEEERATYETNTK